MEDKEDNLSSGYSRLREVQETAPRAKPSRWTSQRNQVLVVCGVLVAFTLCGLIGGVIALKVNLRYTYADLLWNKGQLSAIISNWTDVLESNKDYKVGGHFRTASGAILKRDSEISR